MIRSMHCSTVILRGGEEADPGLLVGLRTLDQVFTWKQDQTRQPGSATVTPQQAVAGDP